MDGVEQKNEIDSLIDNLDHKQLTALLEELKGKECKRLIDYIISLLSA